MASHKVYDRSRDSRGSIFFSNIIIIWDFNECVKFEIIS